MEDQLSGKGVLIDKDTGKVHRINLKPATLHDIQIHSEQPAIGNDWSVECKWVKPLSKRKARKFRYFIERLCKPRKRKYISKREILNSIIKDFVDTGIVQMLSPPEHYIKKFSHKQFVGLYGELIRLRHHYFEVHHPVPEGEDEDEYFKDPFEIVVPDCGDRCEVVINNGDATPI